MEHKDYKWIERLYKRSWEMELLISGFTIILLVESFDTIYILKNWLDFHIVDGSAFAGIFLFAILIVPISLLALVAFLSLNLGFRAYWIALIGLMSRFNPKYESFRFSHHRKQNILQRKQVSKMHKHIDFVDHVGSQLFAVAFLFLCYFAMILFLMIQILSVVYLLNLLPHILRSPLGYALAIYVVIFLLFFIDMISGGVFSKRRWSWINKPFYYIYCFYRYTSAYFLFEKVALSGRKNGLNKAVLFSFAVIVGLIILDTTAADDIDFVSQLAPVEASDVHTNYKIVYASEYDKKGWVPTILIDQRVYQHMPIKLFIPLTATTVDQLKLHCAMTEGLLAEPVCIDAFFQIKINHLQVSTNWAFEEHQINDTPGISFYIDEPDLARGKHTLSVDMPFFENASKRHFWYYPR